MAHCFSFVLSQDTDVSAGANTGAAHEEPEVCKGEYCEDGKARKFNQEERQGPQITNFSDMVRYVAAPL
jgi:hypothetical protein